MSDPRYTDPLRSDPSPLQSDPVLARDESASGGVWGWVAGIAILALIAFVVIAGWNGDRNSASNNASPATSTAQRTLPGPSTTGSGSTSPQPMTPAPSAPAPANRGTQ